MTEDRNANNININNAETTSGAGIGAGSEPSRLRFKDRRRMRMSPFLKIIIGFAVVILLGGVLLSLPISSKEKVFTSFDQAVFTSTSAVCVTGLVVKDTASYWSGGNYTCYDPDLRPRSHNGRSRVCTYCAQAHLYHAAQHYPGSDICPENGRDRQTYAIHSDNDRCIRIDRRAGNDA